MPTSKLTSAIVIGGGIVGLSCAIALQRRGVHTTLLHPAIHKTASWGNAGHIAVEQIEPLASLATLRSMPRRLFWRGGAASFPPGDITAWLPFGMRLLTATAPSRFARGKAILTEALSKAMPAWRRLLAETDASDLLKEDGHFIFWETEASAIAGRKTWRGPTIGTTTVRDANPSELGTAKDLLPSPAGLVRFSGSGQIANIDALADTLSAAFVAMGGTIKKGFATAIAPGLVRTDDGELAADAVLVAAGIGSRDLMRESGHHVPMIAERGYHIEAQASAWPENLPPVVFESRSMIVTRFHHALRASSFVEFSREGSLPDPRKWARLRHHAAELGLPFDGPVREWMGVRPTLPDYLPAIGQSTRLSNLFYAFGHQHLGLTLGPLTGELVGAMMCGEKTDMNLTPFDLRRFG